VSLIQLARLLGLLALVASLLIGALSVPSIAFAQQVDRDPREILLKEEEGGGKETWLAVDEDCSNDRARCARRRWERDEEDSAGVGPIITDVQVWVAKDTEAAKAIFREQERMQKEMPERTYYADGPFKWEGADKIPAEEWNAASACIKDRCDGSGTNRHHRLITRNLTTVTKVYLFGRERNSTPELTVYFTGRMLDRAFPPPPAESS
jgi:hypothetical protein